MNSIHWVTIHFSLLFSTHPNGYYKIHNLYTNNIIIYQNYLNASHKTEGKRSQKRGEVRRDEKSEVKRRLELEMSDDHSDGEGSGGHEADLVDTTKDMEIELHLPREVDEEQDRPREDIK